MKIERAHNASIVDQNVQFGEVIRYFFEQQRNRFHITNITLDRPNLRKLFFGVVEFA